MLNTETQKDLLRRGFSRRDLGRVMSLLTAGASLPFFNEGAMAQLSSLGRRIPPGAVKINANENPAGPSSAALEALIKVARDGGRYQYEETYELMEVAAGQEGIKTDNVIPYPGSSLALHHGVIAFTSPQKGLVTADPGYEAAARAAEFIGAKVTRVPLKPDATHDVKTMVETAASTGAGLIYICNPNNPTGTITPRAEIEWAVANKPKETLILLDEAYIHFSKERFGSDFVAAGKDVVILRTFSKIYGMAGLRAGFAFGRPDLLAKMRPLGAGAMPVTGMVAAKVSLLDKELVPQRRADVAAIREDVCAFFTKHGFKYAPTESNKVMVDTGRPAQQVIAALAKENVFIGRPWSAWPTYTRVTIGTKQEMEAYKKAFLKVMAS